MPWPIRIPFGTSVLAFLYSSPKWEPVLVTMPVNLSEY